MRADDYSLCFHTRMMIALSDCLHIRMVLALSERAETICNKDPRNEDETLLGRHGAKRMTN